MIYYWGRSLKLMTLLTLLGVATLVYPPTLFWAQDRPLLSSQVNVTSSSLQQAVKTYRQGDFGNALALLKKAQQEEPTNSNVNYYLAVCLDKLIRYGEALQEYQYVAKHSEDPQVVDYALYRIQSIKQRLNPQTTEAVSSKPVEIAALPGSRVSSKPVILFNNSNVKESSPQASSPDKSSEKLAVKPALPFSDLNTVVPREVVSIVPLKKNTQALMLEASLNNKVSGTFILDTGATYTSISREMADALGLDLTNCPTVRITTANGRIEVPKVVIERLNVNGLEARNVEATVIDIRKGSSFSGLLGLSFIKKFKLTIDPQAGQLIFQQN